MVRDKNFSQTSGNRRASLVGPTENLLLKYECDLVISLPLPHRALIKVQIPPLASGDLLTWL